MKAICSLFLIFCLSFSSISAQIDWKWEQHNIAFTLADDFKPTTNTGEEFTAQGDGMQFSIFPFGDDSIDDSDITKYTLEIAHSVELEQLDDVDVLEMNGLKGAYVEGYKAGSRVVLLGFIDPETDTNFFSVITFGDDDPEAEKEAIRMISSLRKK